jgi:hypothetical protein
VADWKAGLDVQDIKQAEEDAANFAAFDDAMQKAIADVQSAKEEQTRLATRVASLEQNVRTFYIRFHRAIQVMRARFAAVMPDTPYAPVDGGETDNEPVPAAPPRPLNYIAPSNPERKG